MRDYWRFALAHEQGSSDHPADVASPLCGKSRRIIHELNTGPELQDMISTKHSLIQEPVLVNAN
jgi:hypothetical protein